MHRLRWRGIVSLVMLIWSTTGGGAPVSAASDFASPAFKAQWAAGEAIVPNFWGPLANATDGIQEEYRYSGTNKSRLVQYFDKGRMERYDGVTASADVMVTSGLLATELIRGQIQIADDQFQPQAPPAITIAGDPGGSSATYADLNTKAASLLAAAPNKVGTISNDTIQPTGEPGTVALPPIPQTTITAYDDLTKHNVPAAFAQYRQRVGLTNIGYAISESFHATVKMAGVSRYALMQVFERRVLTYTDANADPFKVEMGNIGQHYYQWRYPTGVPITAPATPTATTTAGDPGQIALQALPAGYTIKTMQMVDLGVEQQQQAILVAENPAVHGQIAALIVQKDGAWTLAFRTKPDDNATATISAYPKTSAHPGFVTASYHLCGANCNNGEHTVIRWDGNGATTVALNGPDDRGAFSADNATGRVNLTGPLYRTQDANCCAMFRYARTWTWQGTSLAPENFTVLPIEGASALPVPQWLMQAGTLIISLEPFQHDPVDANAIAALFKDSFTITDRQGNSCTAPGPAAAQALADLTIPYIGGLWPVDVGFAMTLTTRSSGGALSIATARAGDCTLGGAGVGGYLLTMQASADQSFLVSALAVDQPLKVAPATAIRVPPV